MMKMKRFLTCAIAATTVFALSAAPAFAAAGVDSSYAGTTYTATLSAGAEGKGGTITISEDGVRNGYTLADLEEFAGLEADSKYYVKGVRLSGSDTANNKSQGGPDLSGYFSPAIETAQLTEDEEYVIAYGLTSNKVEYTVRYELQDGTQLHAPDVFYGNEGDRPVVGYRYFDGYYPNALNARLGELVKGEDNSWTFVYYPGTSAPVVTTTTTTVLPAPATQAVNNGTATGAVTPDGTVVAGNPNNAPGAPGNAPGVNTPAPNGENGVTAEGEAVEAENGEAAEGEAVEEGTANVEVVDEEVPLASEELVDVEDEKTPTANIDADQTKKALPLVASVCVAAVAVVAIIAIAVSVRKKQS